MKYCKREKMSKRQATNQLTHDNWDDEEEPEEPGDFKKVSEEELSQRVIKQAKRRSIKDPQAKSPFASFGGFGNRSNNTSASVISTTAPNFAALASVTTSVNNTATNTSASKNNVTVPNFASLTSTTTSINNNIAGTNFGNLVFGQKLTNGNIPACDIATSSTLTKSESPIKNDINDNSQKNSNTETKEPSRDKEYYRLLKGLNESLAQWIQQHVSKNPLCDFTPVFRDYEKHLHDLDTKFPENRSSVSSSSSSITTTSSSVPKFAEESDENKSNDNSSDVKSSTTLQTKSFSFSTSNNTVNVTATASSATSSFNSLPTTSSSTPKTTASSTSFGAPSAGSSYLFGSSNLNSGQPKQTSNIFPLPPVTSTATCQVKPFSFSPSVSKSIEKKSDNGANENNQENTVEEENAEPPKNDFTPVVEEEALYSKRCKLFYNKNGNYVEKGIGVLYLKLLDGNKTQLVVRADTNLGNILLNIMLTASLPIKRMGKNNVLIVCVPNPPVDPKQETNVAVPLLIRVKTEDDANELLQTLQKYQS